MREGTRELAGGGMGVPERGKEGGRALGRAKKGGRAWGVLQRTPDPLSACGQWCWRRSSPAHKYSQVVVTREPELQEGRQAGGDQDTAARQDRQAGRAKRMMGQNELWESRGRKETE